MNKLFPEDRRLLRLATASSGAALWGALLLGFYALVHCPLRDRETSQKARIQELQALLRDNADVHAAHQELAETFAQLEAQISTIHRRIPNDSLEAIFLSNATAIAEEEAIEINNFRRDSIEDFPDYSEVEVVISGTGSFASICRFMNRVSHFERLSTVRKMSLETADRSSRYPFEVVYALQFGMHAQGQSSDNEEDVL